MSRHRGVINACRNEEYDDYYDDDYYEGYDDDYYPQSTTSSASQQSNRSSKVSTTQTNSIALGNFVIDSKSNKTNKKNNKKKGNQGENVSVTPPQTAVPAMIPLTSSQQSFIQQAKDILGSTLTNDELVEIFTRFSGNTERAITYLLDSSTSDSTVKEPTVEDTPPGFLESDAISETPTKLTKPPTHISAGVTVLGKKPVGDSTPIKGHLKSSLSQNKSPAPSSPFPATPPSISRNNSGQLNRMTALSDDDWDESEQGVAGALPHLTMVVAGHVDAGKSTLVGNFLLKIGSVQSRTVHKFQRNAQALGKGSFYLAWVMDESESEREHGVTIDVAERHFQTEVYDFTVLDAPGHRDFIPNMITGASQADVALLVVPASAGEYESSMGENAQTREHAVLLKALGVNQVIIVVNKMETTSPPWSQQRFLQIENEIKALLVELQFGPKALRCIPVSSLEGINLVPSTTSCEHENLLREWYDGPSLMEMINTFKEPPRLINRPLRASILAINSESARGFEVRVKVLQGRLRRGRGVGIALIQGVFDIKRILKDDQSIVETLFAGEMATIQLTDRANRSHEEIKLKESMILYKGPQTPSISRIFKATILTLSPLVPPIIPGSSFELYLHGEEVQCNIRKLLSMTSKVDTIKHPKCIPGNRSAVIRIEVEHNVCIEEFTQCRALGRFALRSKGKTCAVGVCDAIVPAELT